ncbi:MAG: Gfo/Idh/MocA family oxidoreductase [Acidimicrobiales bacterium]|nr:Gfo/Idh/MocA family oxidoreductase [Acidimicrobiales bacterium]
MSDLRVGILGLGQMGRKHLRVFQMLDGVKVVAVGDVAGDPERLAKDIPLAKNAEELVEHNLDMCVIAIPTVDHLEAALVMADAGVHTLIEKPIASNTVEADTLIDVFRKSGLVCCVGHVERFNPAVSEMKKRLSEGQLGDIFQIVTRRQGPFVNRVRDVGVIKDLGTHDIDLSMWLIDDSISAVSARTAHRMGREHEDLAVITSHFLNGVIGNHLVNWISPFKDRLVQVTGENGCFIADTITADLTLWENGSTQSDWDTLLHARGISEGDVIRFAIEKHEPIFVEAEAFRDAVLGIRDDCVTLEEARLVLQVAESCLQSSAKGETEVIINKSSS